MSQNSMLAYRPDIDGLRAIAVITVVLYHFGIGGVSGGFVGVDVFFVISGFLITGIIQREIEQGRFTFVGFYERRIRRIFPALFVVLAATLAVGSWLLLPSDLVLLSKSTLATLLFSSNIFFWRNSGYFDSSSELNPLLHTWSLAVEEQFYIVLPILLIMVHRYARSWLKSLIVISAGASFLACLWQQDSRPSATFYLLPFRAWELLLGTYIAVGNLPKIAKPMLRECLAWLGLILLAIGIIFIKEGPEFPGWHALAPVLGAGLLIYAGGSGQTKVGSLLSIKPMVFVGLISYSLYLWHWPILVYTKYINNMNISSAQTVFGLCLSLLIAVVSYFMVEKPLREKREFFVRKKLFIFSAVLAAILIFSSLSVLIVKGQIKSVSDEVLAMDALGNNQLPFETACHRNFNRSVSSIECRLGARESLPTIVIWGDSHALAMASAFDIALKKLGKSSYLVSYDACPPILDIELDGEYKTACLSQNRAFINWLHKNPRVGTVVLHSYWHSKNYSIQDGLKIKQLVEGNLLKIHLRNTVQQLQKMGKNVIIIGPIPNSPVSPKQLALFKWHNDKLPQPASYTKFKIDSASYTEAVSKYPGAKGVEVMNPSNWLCNASDCLYQNEGKMLYKDGNHINANGAEFLSPTLVLELAKVLNQ